MAVHGKVKKRTAKTALRALPKVARASFLLLWVVLSFAQVASAAVPNAPELGETDWRTGELEIKWSNVTQGFTIIAFAKTYSDPSYHAVDAWTATASTGSYIVSPFENGQTVWHYIVQVNPETGEMSPPSNIGKQTPPITAFIINWPDMFQNLSDMINDANQALQDKMTQLATPSQSAMQGMNNAVNDLQNAVGAGSAANAANGLQSGISDVQSGLSQPPAAMHNDGNGTFTGGAAPSDLAPLEGTMNEASWCVTITYDRFHGNNPVKACLLTDEQLEKMKWWEVVRDAIGYTIYITFGVWVVTRFTPQFKV